MNEIQLELEKNKKLRDRYLAFNQLDEDILNDIENNHEIPEEFHKELSNVLASKSSKNLDDQENKIQQILKKFSPLSLISGSLISGAAITSFLIVVFTPMLTTTNLVRGPETEITIPKNWYIGSDIIFMTSVEGKNNFQSLENVNLKIGTKIIFTFIPLRNITADMQLIDSNGNVSKLYKELVLVKGKTFSTDELTITKPTGKDKLQIIEEGKIIFENILNIIE